MLNPNNNNPRQKRPKLTYKHVLYCTFQWKWIRTRARTITSGRHRTLRKHITHNLTLSFVESLTDNLTHTFILKKFWAFLCRQLRHDDV